MVMGMGMGVGFSSPPPVWTPAALGADLWGYGLPSSIVDTGGKASQWTDLHTTAHHLTQADAAKRLAVAAGNPTGGPCVRGDGTSALWLACADAALVQPTWILLAVKWTSQAAMSRLFDGATLNTGTLYHSAGSAQGLLYAGATVSRNATADGAWHILEAVFDGASSWIALDGGAKSTGNAGAANMGGFTLGIGGHFFNPALFDCSGWLIAKRTPSDADRAAAYAWMPKAAGLI